MKLSVITLALICALFALPASAQLVGTLSDAPQHAFVIGGGVGPTTRNWNLSAGFAERISANTGTYSYSGTDFVPALISLADGSHALAVTTVVHTGIRQILFQQDRFTFAVDAGAGVSLPNSQSPSYNFSTLAAVDGIWRLNKALRSGAGQSNNYLAIESRFTQLTGANGQTVVSLGIAWVHGIN